MSTKASMTQKSVEKSKYRVTNWPEYDRALVNRGSLTVWFEEEYVRNNWKPAPTGKRGAPIEYSDTAIQTLLMLKGRWCINKVNGKLPQPPTNSERSCPY